MVLKKRFELKRMKISDIKLDTTNPNMMDEKKEEALSESREIFGDVDEIVVDKKTHLLADGHWRIKDMIKKGETEADVKLLDFKNDAERRLYRQVTYKVHGKHDVNLDQEEYKKILAKIDKETFSKTVGESEKEIQDLIDRVDKEGKKALDDVEKAEKASKLVHTCPKCGNKFKSAD